MNLLVVEPPSAEPITLQDLYTFLRLDPDDSPLSHPDDDMLTSFIQTAREKVEQATRRALVSQRIRLVQGEFPRYRIRGGDPDFDFYRDGYIELLRPPFIELHSVTYYDEANELQTLDASGYFVDESELVPRLMPVDLWPMTYTRGDAVQVEYTVGYAPDGSPPDYTANIPAALKNALKFEVQLLYDELAPEKRRDIVDTIARLERSFVVPRF